MGTCPIRSTRSSRRSPTNTARSLLDALRARDGRTLSELCEIVSDMSRFGVMKHLAGPGDGPPGRDRARRANKTSLPEPGPDPEDPRPLDRPVRRTVRRRTPRAARPSRRSLSWQRPLTCTKSSSAPRRSRSGRRSSTPTTPSGTSTARASSRRSGPVSGTGTCSPDDQDAVEGTIETFDPPNRLVMTWRVLYDVEMSEEPPSRVEWTLSSATEDGSVTRVTLRHGDLALSPRNVGERPARLGRSGRLAQDVARDGRTAPAGRYGTAGDRSGRDRGELAPGPGRHRQQLGVGVARRS